MTLNVNCLRRENIFTLSGERHRGSLRSPEKESATIAPASKRNAVLLFLPPAFSPAFSSSLLSGLFFSPPSVPASPILFYFTLWLHSQHMEVPRPGCASRPQLQPTHSSSRAGSFNPLRSERIEPAPSQ